MTDGGGAPFTEPAVLVTDAVFVVDTAVDGEPTRGKLVIGQDELALCWEGADRTEWLRIDLDRITDLEPGYVPDQYTDLFEDCVAFSFTDTDGGGIGIVEPAEASVRRLLVALLSQLLDGREALIAHPTERGSQETDEEPEIRPLYAYPYELEFDGESKRGTGTTIKFSSIIDLEEIQIYHEGSHIDALSIRHLQTVGPPLTTELRVVADRTHSLVRRILLREHYRRVRQLSEITLSPREKEFLRAVHSSRASRETTVGSVLDMPLSELTDIISLLKRKKLIRETSMHVELTQTGYMLFTHEKL
jgi:hypothetical protein